MLTNLVITKGNPDSSAVRVPTAVVTALERVLLTANWVILSLPPSLIAIDATANKQELSGAQSTLIFS